MGRKSLKASDTQECGSHYQDMTIEPWDVFDTWPIEQRIGVYRAGVLKYTMRLGTKGERGDDAKKARHYAEKLEEVLDPAALVEDAVAPKMTGEIDGCEDLVVRQGPVTDVRPPAVCCDTCGTIRRRLRYSPVGDTRKLLCEGCWPEGFSDVETTAPEGKTPDTVTCAGCREDVCTEAMMLSVSQGGIARLRCPRCMEVSS